MKIYVESESTALSHNQTLAISEMASGQKHFEHDAAKKKMGAMLLTTFINPYFKGILMWVSLKFVLRDPINNSFQMVRIIAWRRTVNRPLSEPIMSL